MKEYVREDPLFSLCGLNCGLCPRYQSGGATKCPGCGGPDFHLKHPVCAVITCNKKHDDVAYCFFCSAYPCKRYSENKADSFITYQNVLTDFEKAKNGLEAYRANLKEKIAILRFLIENYNDGRKKSYYCNAVNLLPLEKLKEIMEEIHKKIAPQSMDAKEKIAQVTLLFDSAAKKGNIDFRLRK